MIVTASGVSEPTRQKRQPCHDNRDRTGQMQRAREGLTARGQCQHKRDFHLIMINSSIPEFDQQQKPASGGKGSRIL